ncbi:unnamed protein product [Calicophoron daubneyi]|uniref:Rab-GAP TBC domain-containing protein n=1 Tax=Calicophoron daubneyi TaxID=300641 RepID=A0AAV2T944_CALDB
MSPPASHSGVDREVVYVKAKIGLGAEGDSYKKFAIDPNITNYDIFLSILSRCFNIRSDFAVSYLATDDYGEQFYLPLQSDWDLDAAILTSSDPTLRIKVTTNNNKSSYLRDWDVVVPGDVRTNHRRTIDQLTTQPLSSTARRLSFQTTSVLSQLTQRFEKTVASVQRAIGLRSDPESEFSEAGKEPISDAEFRLYLDGIGRVVYLERFCWDVYRGGLEPSLRKVGWRLLLSVFPPETSGQERIILLESKGRQYASMKEDWKQAYAQGRLTEQQLATLASVSIDVVRTDWTNEYYMGESNRYRVCQLFDLLATYCIYHPTVGYNQGMSDLASPLLVIQGDEAPAYLCFCALMDRLKVNFCSSQQQGLITKMQHLHDLLVYTDPAFGRFLRVHDLADLYFTQRWLLLELKREFTFDECIQLFEVQWAIMCLMKRVANGGTTSNSLSQEYLTLAEHPPNFDLIFERNPSPSNSKTVYPPSYSARDVSLINSLVGTNYVVRLPGKNTSSLHRFAYQDIARSPIHFPLPESSSASPTEDIESPKLRNSVDSIESGASSNCHQPNSYRHLPSMLSCDIPFESDLEIKRSNLSSPEEISLTDQTRPIDQPRSQLPSKHSFSSETHLIHLRDSVARLPPPDQLGQGNPFLLFLCLSLMLEYRDTILLTVTEPSDMISFYQRKSKHHCMMRILNRARTLFTRYLSDQKWTSQISCSR